MLKRTITGAVMAIVVIPVCIYSNTLIFPAVVALLSLVATWEMLTCVGTIKYPVLSLPLMVAAFGAPLVAALVNNSDFYFIYAVAMFLLMFIALSLPVFSSGSIDVAEAAVSFVSVCYITTGFVSIVILRNIENGVYYYLVPILAPPVCDIFAYFCGRLFGKHKLIPKVSPKKTVEGAIGGTVFCVAACTGYGAIIAGYGVSLPVWAFALGGLVIALVSQIGDLIASAIKRKYDIKDYGWIFPGHGGVMDRFDSIIATAPLFLIFIIIVNMIGA